MGKTLLYLEDNGYLLTQTLRFLGEDGYEVNSFTRIDQAIRFLQKNPDGADVDCIITDLNMDDQWLGDHRRESNGGLLSGWVWLKHFVYANEKYRKMPSIIYSGYITDLNDYLGERNELYLLRDYKVSLVRKGGNNDEGYTALYQELKKIIPD